MTKKDYIRSARAINLTLADFPEAIGAINILIGRLCVEFNEDNPRFQASKFIKACKGDNFGGSSDRLTIMSTEAKRLIDG